MNFTRKKLTQILDLLDKHKLLSYIKDSSSDFTDEAHLFTYDAKGNENSLFFKNKSVIEFQAGGSSFSSREEALTKCLGEFLERLTTCSYDPSDLILETYQNLKNKYVIPLTLIEEKFKNKKIVWSHALNYITQEKILIPASYVYINSFSTPTQNYSIDPSSNGAAGGTNAESTILSAIYEVIERDAFLCMYLNKIPTPKIKLSSIKNKEVQKLLMYCNRYQYDVQLFDITNDIGVPTFFTLLFDRSQKFKGLILGSKSHLNQTTAIMGSIQEAVRLRSFVRVLEKDYYLKSVAPQPHNIFSFSDRVHFWLQPYVINSLDFLTNQSEISLPRPSTNIPKQKMLPYILNIFKKKGYHLFVATITNDLCKQLGYHVYKAIIPEMQYMYFREKQEFLNIKRLQETSRYFGQEKFELNKIPHPFI